MYRYHLIGDWTRLTASERRNLRLEYRWLRYDGLHRTQAKATVDRVALMLTRRPAA